MGALGSLLESVSDPRDEAVAKKAKGAYGTGALGSMLGEVEASAAMAQRAGQRAYAEKPQSALAQITVDPAREMVANLGDRAKVLATLRSLSPEQRQEALKLTPGIAQQLGDNRGGAVGRTLGAVSRGISNVSQPAMELAGAVTGTDWGGTPEEIAFIRQLEAAASQEFNPALPSDPWYERGPLQAVEMAPWMATVVGGAGVWRAAATGVAGRVAGRAAAGGKVAGVVQKAGQAVGNAPRAVGLPALTAGKAGELAGITAAAFPGQYAQEVDSLKELGMVDDSRLRLLAGGTAAIAGLVEGVVPNPFAGKVALTEGALKAARQYLWEAAKKAPGEMSEEYLQGVTSGLGEYVAQYVGSKTEFDFGDGQIVKFNPAERKSIADALQKGWEQAKEAALPMAFLLGVPDVGGAGLSAARAQRLTRLQEILAKGPVSRKDGKELGIEGNQDERTAIAAAEKSQLEQEAASGGTSPPADQTGTQPPVPVGPPLQPQEPVKAGKPMAVRNKEGASVYGSLVNETDDTVVLELDNGEQQWFPKSEWKPHLIGRTEWETKDASQVPTNEGSPNAQGNAREGSQVPVGSQVRQPGQEQGGAEQTGKEPAAPEVQVATPKGSSFEDYANEWNRDLAKRLNKPESPVTDKTRESLKKTLDGLADTAIKQGKATKFASDNAALDEMQMRELQNVLRSKGYEPSEIARSSENGVDYLGFTVSKQSSAPKVAPTTEASKPPATEQPQEGPVSPIGDKSGEAPAPKQPATWSKREGADGLKAVYESGDFKIYEGEDGVFTASETRPNGREYGFIPEWDSLEQAQSFVDSHKSKPKATQAEIDARNARISKEKDISNLEYALNDNPDVNAINTVAKYGIDPSDKAAIREQIKQLQSPSTAGTSEGTTVSPTVSPDAPVSQETSKGKAEGEEQSSEASAKQPESKWQSETRVKLESVPALKDAKIETDETTATAKVTRPDGLSTTIHFNADEELAKAAKAKLRNPESIHGRYVREPGSKEGKIYLRSDANHSNILNHEVMHWLEDSGVVTKEEVEQYGGREAIAERYGKWAELRFKKKDSVFQKIHDFLEPLFSSQHRFFEDVSKRKAAEKPRPEPAGEPNLSPIGDITPPTAEQSSDEDFDAEMEKLMAGLAEPESGLAKPRPAGGRKKSAEPAARKPRSVKKQPAKTPQEKSEDDRARAAAKREEAKQAMRDAFGKTQTPKSGFDPQIGIKVAQAAKLYIEAGALDFRAFIRDLAEDFGKPWVEDKAKYLESAWRTANKLKWIDSPTGKVADILTEVADATTPAETTSAQSRIASRVRDSLENGEALTSKSFFAIADEEFGGTRASNDYGDSQATDALELGVNRYLQGKTDANVSPDEAKATLERIQQVMQLVPRHRGRTGNKDLLQQFSTPPAYAYAVSWIANVTDADVVLEPSAGMGGIAIHAANSGAKVYANELDPARAEGLRELPLERVFTEDAEQIGAILKDKTPGLNTIVMNPPFSRAGMRMGDRMVQGTDRKHIDEALTLLPDGGRLVAIVGAGLHGQGQKMTQWLDNLPYQLAANVEVAREVYRGYGTEFPTRVLVIDKVPRTSSELVRSVDSLSELIEITEGVRNARPVRNVESVADQPSSPQGNAEDGQGAGTSDDARDTAAAGVPVTTDSGAGQAESGQRGSDRGGSVDDGNAATGPAGSSASGKRGRGKGRGQTRKPSRPSGGTKAKPAGDAAARKPDDGSRGSGNRGGGLTKVKATSQPRAASVKTELGDSTFEVYTPSVVVAGAKSHPAPIVESAAMAAVDAPRIDYEIDLMPGVMEGYVNDDGVYIGISDIQLEAIAMAGAAHEQKLPNGERRGFLIGDGTGVGKAREALGIIMDDFIKRGTGERRKAVFITKNDGLVKDAVGEWVGVGGDAAEMQPLSNVGSGAPVSYESGVLTLSYDTLKGEASVQAKSQGNTRSRVEQIIDWVGEDFDGVVVFDEAHLMANSMDTGSGNQTKGASKRALAGVDLQQRLPNARFVYLSATAATEVRNLAYAERLGLWGPGTSFDSKHRFVNEIESGGVAAMEKVAADMKAMGMYVARNLSFDDGTENGRVEFDRIQHTLSSDQRRVYDKLSEAWLKVLADIDRALDITDNAKGKSRILSAFWGSNQRFWNDVVTTMMAPTLIKNIESDLAAGRSVVIQLSTTKEAATGRAIASMQEGQTYDEIDASPRRSLMEYVERAFPTQRHETYIDDAGNERSRPVLDFEGNPVHDPQAIAMKERLLDEIGSLDVAARGPIDMILDHFGTDMVSEISGRSQRLVKGEDGRLELEKRGKAAARADRDSFMDGKKRVLLFSEAGGTGASYHASLSAANQQRRSHYLWQPGWSAPVAVQGLGRAHRSNQASAPKLHLLEPNLEGYKRFISTIARRLGQLGALTKGQRTAADAGLFGANDNLESTEANSALFQFMQDAVNDNIEGIDREFLVQRLGLEQLAGGVAPSPEMFTMTQFLNRMLNLPLGEQNRVFGEFQSRMDNIVAQAIQDGTLDQGMETLKAERIVKANETIVNEHETGAKTKLVELTLTHKVKPRSFEDMLHEAASYTQFSLQGFVKSNTTGNVSAVINQNRTSQDTSGRTMHDAMFIGVNGNTYGHSLEQLENAQYWEKLSREQAKELWDKQFRESPTTRESTTHLLTGALLPVWNKIPGNQSRVLRALTADGETILGRVIPERLLQRTLDSLGVSSEGNQKQYTPLEAIQAIYQGGTVELANGWTIKKRTIDGEDNIEIKGPDYSSTEGITNAGGFTRRIDYTTRFFIPFNDTNGEVLGEITRISPIASIVASSRGSGEGGGIARMKAVPTRQSRTQRLKGESEAAGIAAADIQKTAERLFDVAIRQGGFNQRAAGIYKWLTKRKGPPSPEVIRTAEDHYANLAVIAHEIAHHIDEKTKAVRSMPKEVKDEVSRLDYEPEKGRAFEGWAEFLRRYMTEPPIDVAGNMIPNPGLDAPKTLAWFEGAFLQANPEVAKSIAEFRKYAQQFAQQSVFQRVGTLISDRQPQDLSFGERWLSKARRRINRLKTNFIDKFHTLEWIQNEAKDRGHEGIGIYDLTMAHYMSASSHATIAFEEGVRSLQTGAPIGKTALWSLRDHLESDSEYNEAVLYALARHTLFMDDTKPGYNTGMDVQDAEALIEEVKASGKQDRYEAFSKALAQFNDDLINMLVEAGALARKDADAMLHSYEGQNYFPLHRVQDTERSMFVGSGVGFVNLGRAVPKRSSKGSGRQIVDPIDATIARAIRFYGRAIQARQQQVLAETLDPLMGGVGGMGGLMDRVDPRRKVMQGTIEEILKTLVDEGIVEVDDAKAMRIAYKILNPDAAPSEESLAWFAERHGIEEIDGEYDWADLEHAAEQEPNALAVISLWRPDYTPSATKRTVVIYDKQGNPIMYEMDPDLYATATGMDEIQFGPFISVFREASRYFKTGAVGASTGFGTANLFRDYWEFQGKARHTKGFASLGKPPAMLARYVAEKARKLAGGKANDPLIRLYEESGGKVYSVVGPDVHSRRHYRRRRIGKSTMSKLGLSIKRPGESAESLLQGIQDLIAISDAPPRLADAEAAIKEDGFVTRDGRWFDLNANAFVDRLPEATRIKAAVAMAEATINFKRVGAKGQYIEAFMPFFNATVQAMYRQYGQFKSFKSLGKKDVEGMRAKRFLVYLSALASTGVLYWLLRNDDDDWREQDAYLKDGYWTWGKNGKTYYRIPKPRDSAVVSNVVENMLDAWYYDDARDMREVVIRDFGGRLPTGGGFLRGVGETYFADYDFFRERDLTPENVKDLPKEQQVESTTTRASKAMGQVTGRYLNTSPIQLEHLLTSASGGFYHRMADLYDAIADGRVGPEHYPFIRGLKLDRHQARSVSDFYDAKSKLEEQIKRDAVDKGKVSDEAIGKLSVMEGHAELMTALRKLEGKTGTRRNYEYQPYIAGLARHSLGYKELESNPNPFTAKDVPEPIAALMGNYEGRAIIHATETLKDRKEYKSEEDYETQRATIVRGKAKLDALGISLEKAKQALLEYWRERWGSPSEMKNGRPVLKDAVRTRLRQLTKLYAQ